MRQVCAAPVNSIANRTGQPQLIRSRRQAWTTFGCTRWMGCLVAYCFRNEGTSTMRMVLTYSPSGIEKFFEETLEPALDRRSGPPPNIQALADRLVAAGPKYGIEFFAPGASF